jgi:nitrate reductase NapD
MVCDRRNFVRGAWLEGAGERESPAPAAGAVEIASILVQTRPERLDEAERAIAAIAGTEIHSRDPRGKLVVVIEAPEVGAVGAALNAMALLPPVLSATLVYHATDAD